jgi:exopolyphosphatase / guanosine-5'-triphosphate,3'-diphosphate pyrophosphatase|uniref:Ppx/GppA phosphatase family protein n=1 Tax=Cephaloticoccus sp. TaxID=1985742 RepID=UPI004049ECC9
MTPSRPCVAVIDIGSNSIKALVARQSDDGTMVTLLSQAIEARISAGINQTPPRLSAEGMQNGLTAITELMALIAPHQPIHVQVVATSAVRDALNGDDFQRQVQAATGHQLRILSGSEEANLIGRGLRCDPSLPTARNFYIFDLGGGSLECLRFVARQVEQAVSLQLGCVRMTEKFVTDRSREIPSHEAARIAEHTLRILQQSGFQFSLPAGFVAIGTGGTMATVRAMLAARAGLPFEEQSPLITAEVLKQLSTELGRLNLPARQKLAGLPPARADVFPAALATLVAIAGAGGISEFHHSLYNLRYGVAAELLER